VHTKSNEKLAFWQRRIEEYRSSGLSRRVFCERKGIKKSSLDYWFTRIRKERAESGLVEVKVYAGTTPLTWLELIVADKYRVHLHRDFDPELLVAVLKALERLA
jgi:hypothetical protein